MAKRTVPEKSWIVTDEAGATYQVYAKTVRGARSRAWMLFLNYIHRGIAKIELEG